MRAGVEAQAGSRQFGQQQSTAVGQLLVVGREARHRAMHIDDERPDPGRRVLGRNRTGHEPDCDERDEEQA